MAPKAKLDLCFVHFPSCLSFPQTECPGTPPESIVDEVGCTTDQAILKELEEICADPSYKHDGARKSAFIAFLNGLVADGTLAPKEMSTYANLKCP